MSFYSSFYPETVPTPVPTVEPTVMPTMPVGIKRITKDMIQIEPKSFAMGGFGAVHKAIYAGIKVAVKVPSMSTTMLMNETSAKSNWLNEITMWFQNPHPNIVTLMGIYSAGTKECIVMELMRCSLQDLLYTTDSISEESVPNDVNWADKLGYLSSIINAMVYLHSLGVIHGDLKTANILISLDSKIAKLSDFGLSVMHDNPNKKRGYTPHYAAPECLLSNGCVSREADIWAIGMIVYELINHQKPWLECSSVEEIKKYVTSGLKPNIITYFHPTGIKDVMDSCITYDMSKRPTITDLKKLVDDVIKAYDVTNNTNIHCGTVTTGMTQYTMPVFSSSGTSSPTVSIMPISVPTHPHAPVSDKILAPIDDRIAFFNIIAKLRCSNMIGMGYCTDIVHSLPPSGNSFDHIMSIGHLSSVYMKKQFYTYLLTGPYRMNPYVCQLFAYFGL